MPHKNHYLTLLNQALVLEKNYDINKAIQLIENFLRSHHAQAGRTSSPYLKNLKSKLMSLKEKKENRAASKIQQYWRNNQQQKKENSFVAITPDLAQHLESLHKKRENVKTQPTLEAWVTAFLTGAATNGTAIPTEVKYRKQFTRETSEFHQHFETAKRSIDEKTAIERYQHLLSNPNFIYEAMNLFLLGKIEEVELILFSEIYALLMDQKILTFTTADKKQQLCYTCPLEINSVDWINLLNPQAFFPSSINYQSILVFNDLIEVMQSVAPKMAELDEDRQQKLLLKHLLETAIFRGTCVSAQEIETATLLGKRTVSLPYPDYPTLKTLVHDDERGPHYIYKHDLIHTTLMYTKNEPYSSRITRLEFLNHIINYLKNLSANNLTAYQYYLIDFFIIDVFADRIANRTPLEFVYQNFKTSVYSDEIILYLCFFIENTESVNSRINLQDKSFTLHFNSSLQLHTVFTINVTTLLEKFKQLMPNDGAKRILLFKKYFLKFHHEPTAKYSDLKMALSQNIHLFRFYCTKEQLTTVYKAGNHFLTTTNEGQLNGIQIIWLKFSSKNTFGKTIQQFCPQETDAIWIKNMMMPIIASEAAYQQYLHDGKKINLSENAPYSLTKKFV